LKTYSYPFYVFPGGQDPTPTIYIPAFVCVGQAKTGPAGWKWISENAGRPHDEHVVRKAVEEVEEFCRVLQLEGVTVCRPEPMRWDQLGTFRTPYFEDGG